MHRYLLPLLLLAACTVEGPAGPAGPAGTQGPIGPAAGSPIESGTRIKMRVGTTPDGAKLFLGWHDADLGVDCEFLVAADGKTRCLPVGPVVDEAQLLFFDDACTRRAVKRLFEGESDTPSHVLAVDQIRVESGREVIRYRVYATSGKLWHGPLFALDGGVCVEATPNTRVEISAAEPDEFVPLAESVE